MGPRYQAIASFLAQGPAWLRISLGQGMEAGFLVSSISPPSSAPQDAPFSSFRLEGPNGNQAFLQEEQITHIQPDGPQDGTSLHITLDTGLSIVLARDR
ncbi:MAG TPA: hypothetical protein GXX30_06040 [Firmicutes bacterium]|uniref:Uncharacterized protein n=1 Tax=Candidatus Fermentithermobacillus carboniphilus TaxID=3085328 RepID=A0AAT9LDI2_9FIRM|nr:MAG: hypothetical protein IMF26_02875 [Candidatus Fermentithermobacillus carboniphilus]HHW18444.1 hypothetical protein [Candidatus Fermentithermobacillaceae bacterium]